MRRKSKIRWGRDGVIKLRDETKEELKELRERLAENELDLRAVMMHLDLETVVYKKHRTGIPGNPWVYGRKVVKRSMLEDSGKA